MDTATFLAGFAIVLGIWNVATDFRGRGTWFWIGLAMIALGVVMLGLGKGMGIKLFDS